jgi:hypothetical protein
MSSTTDISGSSALQSVLGDAVKQYQTKVRASLVEHQLAIRLRSCDTIESVNEVLEEQVQAFRKSLGNDLHPKMMKSILRTVQVLHMVFTGSGTALRGPEGAIQSGHGVASVVRLNVRIVSVHVMMHILQSISPVCLFSSSARVLVTQAVKDVNASYDLYTQASPTMKVREVAVEIIVEMLSTLALATKQIKQGRLSEWIFAHRPHG